MASHLGFESQIPKVIVFTVMFILLSHTCRRSDTDVQNCCTCAHSQNRCETVTISILQNSQRAEPTILHFVKNWLVGTIRGSFFMFVESGCISTIIEFTVP